MNPHLEAALYVAFDGIIAYSKSVARFAAPYNINVNTISPGNIYSPMTAGWLDRPDRRDAFAEQIPNGRVGESEDVTVLYVFWLQIEHATW
jgi:NAD(P)-dependent dehydrogenase (short-subunit alcohol dehydrogenase family)